MHRPSVMFAGVIPVLCVLFTFLDACGNSRAQTGSAETSVEAPRTVAAAKATVQDLSKDVVLTAEFIPFEEVDLMAKVSGYVKEISVDVGDHVKQGQVLATIEIPEMQDDVMRAQATIEQAEAEVTGASDDIRRAESAHDIAHVSYQRLSNVVKERPGLIAQQEIDDARGRDLGSEAQLSSANAKLASARQRVSVTRAELARVKTMLAYTQVTAPFSGVITKRYANTGSMIQAGTASQTQAMPLVRLSENSRLRLILPVPESDVSLVKVGQPLTVKVPTLNRNIQGKVARFSDRVQLATRTMDTEVDVPNPSFTLVPGMYAEVDFTTESHKHVVTVPIGAVDLSAGNETAGKVMVVSSAGTEEGQLLVRDVSLGMQTADSFEVRSGLMDGEVVVTGNRASLRAGQSVRPKLAETTTAKARN
ncbi:MAG: efflux RND transporter periplasmic adaptor subunit [Acidobacteriota bacterium]